MSEREAPTFRVLLAHIDGAPIALDASALTAIAIVDGCRIAHFAIAHPCTAVLDPDDADAPWADRVVRVDQSALHALPALLEDLEARGVLGIVEHEARLFTLLDVRSLCRGTS